MIQDVEGLKPNLLQTIAKRMSQIDQGGAGSLGGGKHLTGSILDQNNRNGLEQIPEAHDEDGVDLRKSALSNIGGADAKSQALSQLKPSGSQSNLSQ